VPSAVGRAGVAARSPVAVAQVLVGTALFGTVGTARALGPDAPAGALGGARALLAAAVLVPLAAAAGDRWHDSLRRRSVWLAGTCQAGFQLCFLSAVLLTGVATGTLLAIGSAPLLAGLLHRWVDRAWALATAVGVAGLTLLVTGGSAGARVDGAGALLALGAGLSYAGYAVATGRAMVSGASPTAVTAGTFTVTALLLAPFLVLSDLAWLATPDGAAVVAWLALAPTVASYLLLSRGLQVLPAPVVTTLGLAEPVVATLLAVAVLGERPTAVAWLGAALVLASLAATAVTAGARRRVRGSTP
jgi:DME family drug/metabolite transporter